MLSSAVERVMSLFLSSFGISQAEAEDSGCSGHPHAKLEGFWEEKWMISPPGLWEKPESFTTTSLPNWNKRKTDRWHFCECNVLEESYFFFLLKARMGCPVRRIQKDWRWLLGEEIRAVFFCFVFFLISKWADRRVTAVEPPAHSLCGEVRRCISHPLIMHLGKSRSELVVLADKSCIPHEVTPISMSYRLRRYGIVGWEFSLPPEGTTQSNSGECQHLSTRPLGSSASLQSVSSVT